MKSNNKYYTEWRETSLPLLGEWVEIRLLRIGLKKVTSLSLCWESGLKSDDELELVATTIVSPFAGRVG